MSSLTDMFNKSRFGGGKQVDTNRVAMPANDPTRPIEGNKDPNKLGTGAGVDQPDVRAELDGFKERLDKAEKRLRDKDRYINDLRQERDSWKTQASVQRQADPQPVEADPFDDEGTVALFNEAFSKDPVRASREMQKYYADKVKQEMESKFNEVSSSLQQERQQEYIVKNFYNELTEAAEMSDGAKEIITEAIDSNWTEGELVETLRTNPELAKIPNALSSTIIKMALKRGGSASTSTPQNQTASAVRTKASTRTTLTEPEPTEEDFDQEFKNRIRNASGSGRLSFL